ncbi:acyl-CoA thioesterase [Halobacteriaceae archaeon GCM10025711]
MSETATLTDSYTEMTQILLPNDTNNLGRALGGAVLNWMDICGGIAAMRFSGRYAVTASMDNVDFKSAIDLGEIVVVKAYVYDTGTTSIEVKVDVHAEDPIEGTERETTSSFLTFVAIDDDGKPTPVPDLETATENEVELRKAAIEERREHRRALGVSEEE